MSSACKIGGNAHVKSRAEKILNRSVHLVAFGAIILVLAIGKGAGAQSLDGVISQAGKAISQAVNSAERALTKKKSRRKGQSGDEDQVVVVPPVPERRPSPWTKRASSNQTKSVAAPKRKAPRAKSARIKTRETNRGATKQGKPSRDKTAENGTSKVAPADKSKKVVAPAKVPLPDVWSPVEINVARARCSHLLKQVDAVTLSQPPIKKGPCGDAAPVKLVALGKNPQVAVSPPAIVNCEMVHALHGWLEKDLQPLAKKHLGSPIITIENMSSYSCRNAYGRTSTKLSEHGLANALDIRGFLTDNGKRARLLAHWGPTQKDIAVAKKRAATKALAEAKAARDKAQQLAREAVGKSREPDKARDTARIDDENTDKASVPLPTRSTLAKSTGQRQAVSRKLPRSGLGIAPSRLGGPKGTSNLLKNKTDAAVKIPRVSNTANAKFLRAAHERACKIFGTVLGPEANEAHRNHFHVDLAERRRSNYCE